MTKRFGDQKPVVLMFHAKYRTPGGEEGSFNEEAALFQEMGYEVIKLEASNDSNGSQIATALCALLNPSILRESLRLIRQHNPSLIYVNNLWMSLSPAVLWAARFKNVPTLQALRNYRIVCPSAKLNNDGACLRCGAKVFPFRCIMNRCYNDSRAQTLLVALFSLSSRLANTGRRNHRYLSTSAITKKLITAAGLPSSKIRVRPNFLAPSLAPSFAPGQGVTYVGRLSEEKGVSELVEQWRQIPDAPTLKLIGEGPLADRISGKKFPNIEWLGSRPKPEVLEILRSSALTVVPSQWAEPFGRVAIESMSVGTPVIHTNGGALTEIVGDTGVFLRELNSGQLADAVKLLDHPEQLRILRQRSFARYESLYSNSAALEDMKTHINSLAGS